jgi:hypothetical protein
MVCGNRFPWERERAENIKKQDSSGSGGKKRKINNLGRNVEQSLFLENGAAFKE